MGLNLVAYEVNRGDKAVLRTINLKAAINKCKQLRKDGWINSNVQKLTRKSLYSPWAGQGNYINIY